MDVELLVSAARKDDIAVAAIRPVKGESSRTHDIVCHADPRSRDPRANDISGMSSQIANPQPPTKGATVRDVQGVTRCLPNTLGKFPHRFLAKPITLWDSLGAFPGQNPSRTWGVPFRASVLCSTACCSGRREKLRRRIVLDLPTRMDADVAAISVADDHVHAHHARAVGVARAFNELASEGNDPRADQF